LFVAQAAALRPLLLSRHPKLGHLQGDAIAGAFQFLQIGVRQDVTVDRSTDAVLTDGDGAVIISAFEQDVTVPRCRTRIACAVGKPVGANGDPIRPLATASWSGAAGASATAARARGTGQYTKKEAV
jgi:hypothetical protein